MKFIPGCARSFLVDMAVTEFLNLEIFSTFFCYINC